MPLKPANDRLLLTLAALAVTGHLGACASSEGGPGGLPALPSLAAAPKIELPKVAPGNATTAPGTATEVYTRVSRGVLTCWFGANGSLKGAYIYFGEAEPPSKGGKAQIDVRTRDKDAADPRSLKAFSVDILPSPEGTRVEVENFKLDPALGERLRADIFRWSAEEEGCGEAPVTAGWTAAPALTTTTNKVKPAAKP